MDSLNLLKNLGFTEYEARVYLALSELGPSGAKEISNYSKLPRNKTYEMLNKLEKNKKIVSLPVSPKKFKILDINQLKEEVSQRKKSINLLEKNLGKFIEESNKPKLTEFKEIFWIIRSKKAIIQKMSAQNKLCKKEILSINRLSISNPVNLRNMKNSISNGLKAKMLVPNTKENTHVKKWIDIGVEIREYNESKFGPIGTRLSVFDKNTVRITFGEPEVYNDEDYITLWAESPHLANILRNYFMNIWKQSKIIK
ncbi:TrmB family transcriptional regulator [archaeon]|jgi:sugar-specific transcriptional regulator TrmB|nr:TrmB family transcriptional regulator [archaeon]MBT4022944.1 TrmB family transcriptional regulator [archaeon]MBT4271935.1 TrmB family transcriptional regulator [archaeon]MBT4461773.1 TrmB family transcriptional regulator [archaeon]MBT5424097.1 TrmB family transcriptional regulator [archaeon]